MRQHTVGMMEAFTGWARRTSSSFAELRSDFAPTDAGPAAAAAGELIYRLKHWPQLPASMKTAEVLRLLSLMSSRPVRRAWVLDRTRLDGKQLDALLRRLAAQDALEIIDTATLPVDRPR